VCCHKQTGLIASLSLSADLRNDHKKVMGEIERKLHQLHQTAREQQLGSQDSQNGQEETTPTQQPSSEVGFARVTLVTSGSPSHTAVSVSVCMCVCV